MNNRRSCVLVGAAASQLFKPDLLGASPAGRPNIVLILAADVGFSDIGCYGGEVHIPNIDKLAEGGIEFPQFYNCGKRRPSRAWLATGQQWCTHRPKVADTCAAEDPTQVEPGGTRGRNGIGSQ